MEKYRKYTDQALAYRLKDGDHAAFTEIYRRYWSVLWAHALKMVRNEDDARDLIQELFVGLWEKSDQLNPEANLAGYLYTILRNRILDLIEQQKVRAGHLESLARFGTRSQRTVLETITEREFMQALSHEVAQLPAKMRRIFELRTKEHLSYREIAEHLEISDKTVKKQINNAIKIIKPRLHNPGSWLMIILPFFSGRF